MTRALLALALAGCLPVSSYDLELQGTWYSVPGPNGCYEAVTLGAGDYSTSFTCPDSDDQRWGTYEVDGGVLHFRENDEVPFDLTWSLGDGFVRGSAVWRGPSLKLGTQYYRPVTP